MLLTDGETAPLPVAHFLSEGLALLDCVPFFPCVGVGRIDPEPLREGEAVEEAQGETEWDFPLLAVAREGEAEGEEVGEREGMPAGAVGRAGAEVRGASRWAAESPQGATVPPPLVGEEAEGAPEAVGERRPRLRYSTRSSTRYL